MKNWKFKKGENDIKVYISRGLQIIVEINEKTEVMAEAKNGALAFVETVNLIRDGKKFPCSGFNIDSEMYSDIVNTVTTARKAAKEEKERAYYNAHLHDNNLIELSKWESSDYLYTVDYVAVNKADKERLERMHCVCGQYSELKNELMDKVEQYETADGSIVYAIAVKDCEDYCEKYEKDAAERRMAAIEEEMKKPEEQIITVDDSDYEIRVGDIYTRNYCKYVVNRIVPDIDYPELKHCYCTRKGVKEA